MQGIMNALCRIMLLYSRNHLLHSQDPQGKVHVEQEEDCPVGCSVWSCVSILFLST